MEINIRLSMGGNEDDNTRVAKAKAKKAQATETMEEAWVRIFGMKNSDADFERLKEVKRYMDAGKIGRDPNAKGKFSKAEALRLWKAIQEAQRDDKLKELVANTPKNYKLITSVQALDEFVADLYNEPIIALDTETTGLDYFGDDSTVGMSFTLPKADYHVYIPYGHVVNDPQLPKEVVLEAVKPRLESGHLKKVLHNAKFDIHMLYADGIELRGLVWDTMVAMQLLNENEPSMQLKVLATKYLKEPADTFSALFGKTMFYEVPLDIALAYAGKDTELTWKLYQFQLTHLKRYPQILKYYREVENRIISVSVEMERTGFVMDLEKAQALNAQLTAELAELHERLVLELGDINFNSPAQLSKVLFEDLKLQRHLPPKMKLSTDVKTLKQLAKHNKGCEILLEYREKTKLLGTYVDALPKQIKKDGRIHGNFNQSGTVTGRFSSNNPNLQNQPKYARKLFIAPKGMVIIGGDFSQQEPRLLAHFSGEQALIDAYLNGQDLYSTMASTLFGVPLEECGDGSVYRKMMKFGVLSVMYGTGPKTLAGQLGITEAEAQNFIDDFYETFKDVAQWIENNKEFARRHGYVWMIGEQRKRRLPQARGGVDRWEQFRAERQATNAIIQGSASIQTKLTMIALQEWCEAKRASGRYFAILATVHDEILIYAPEDVTREEVHEFRDIMVETMQLVVPNKTDIEIMRTWGNGYGVDEWYNGGREESLNEVA